MKTLEEIENLSLEELEQKAAGAAPAAPEGLQERIRATLAADTVRQETLTRRPAGWVPWTTLAVAAAAAAVLILPQHGPKDTFDDPYLAYAEVEKTFRTISDKMSAGVGIAREAGAAAELPRTILNQLQSDEK